MEKLYAIAYDCATEAAAAAEGVCGAGREGWNADSVAAGVSCADASVSSGGRVFMMAFICADKSDVVGDKIEAESLMGPADGAVEGELRACTT